MAINNSNKPITAKQDVRVGATFKERKDFLNNNIGREVTTSRVKEFRTKDRIIDTYGEKKETDKKFSPDAQFIRGRNVLPLKRIESGKHIIPPEARIDDNMRCAILDDIINPKKIASYGENKSVKSISKPTKS